MNHQKDDEDDNSSVDGATSSVDDGSGYAEREELIAKAAKHCKQAQAMRTVFNNVKLLAQQANESTPHAERIYCIVVDYCMNLAVPYFGSEQPGETYYYSPLNVFLLGIVDVSNNDHLHAFTYTEGEGKKGGNNVASLIYKFLQSQGWVRDDEIGGNLSIFMDNCSGQNKNRMVLRLALYLVERGFFKTVRFEFFIRGHTKNPADRKFNILKKEYRKKNVYTMEALVKVLNENEGVTCTKVVPADFGDWDKLLDKFYRSIPTGKTHKNHRFIVSKDAGTTKMEIQESALEEDEPTVHDMEKTRNGDYNGLSRKEALQSIIPVQLIPPGLKEIKQVELATKYRPLIPAEVTKTTDLYNMPSKDVIDRVKAHQSDTRKRKLDLTRGFVEKESSSAPSRASFPDGADALKM